MLIRTILSAIRSAIAIAVRNTVGSAVEDGITKGLDDGLKRSFGDDYKGPLELQDAVTAAVLRLPALGDVEEVAAKALAEEKPVATPSAATKKRGKK